jgi:hypothetical protein
MQITNALVNARITRKILIQQRLTTAEARMQITNAKVNAKITRKKLRNKRILEVLRQQQKLAA